MTRRISGKLFSVEITRGMDAGLYSDGGNLWLQVSKIGTKSWLFRYTLNGRSRAMGLGALHTVTLSEARNKATTCRKLLVDGIDPIVARDADAASQAKAAANTKTFDECAAAYIAVHSPEWRNAKHSLQWTATIATYASPTIGKLPIKDVTSARVLEVLEPIWNTKPETAARLRGRIECVWNWAKARGYCSGDNPAVWRGNLKDLLPAIKKSERVKHHPALPYEQMGEFMVKLRKESGTAARALEFTVLTACRSGEVIGARWDEINLAKEIWTVPAARMKAKKAHRIPLSLAAVKLLRKLEKHREGEYVFPGVKAGLPLSNMAMLALLKRMERTDLTVHGFRSTFRDWAAELTNFPRHVCEMALAHTIGDKVEAAYRRGDLFQKRRLLMLAWAKHCDMVLTEGSVVPITQRQA